MVGSGINGRIGSGVSREQWSEFNIGQIYLLYSFISKELLNQSKKDKDYKDKEIVPFI